MDYSSDNKTSDYYNADYSNTLLYKYLHDTLTPEELRSFRGWLQDAPQDKVAAALDNAWDEKAAGACADSQREARIKSRIDGLIDTLEAPQQDESAATISLSERLMPVLRHTLRYAAILLVPVLAFTTWHFYSLSHRPTLGMMTVEAPAGSLASATLPDGSEVILNHDSRLTYDASAFNGWSRDVALSGEATFEVAHNKAIPFNVKAGALTIHVTGTQFNVLARREAATTEVALLKGRIELTSERDADSKVVLSPGQKAVFDRRSGRISVGRSTDVAASTQWQRHEMKFTDVPLSYVASRLAEEYGVRVILIGTSSSHFTGVLPTDDLDACLRILKVTYGLSYHVSNGAVRLSMK